MASIAALVAAVLVMAERREIGVFINKRYAD
jgi:hypothetical protein